VCLGRINSETAKLIWLTFCTGMEVCPRHCISHFGGDVPRGLQMTDSKMGRKSEFGPFGKPLDCDELENGKLQRFGQWALNISTTGGFQKCKGQGSCTTRKIFCQSCTHQHIPFTLVYLTLYGHITTVEQWTIIQQYSDWYTGHWWAGCYIWYSVEGPERAGAPPIPILDIPNLTALPSTASVPTSYYSMWHYNCLWTLKG